MYQLSYAWYYLNNKIADYWRSLLYFRIGTWTSRSCELPPWNARSTPSSRLRRPLPCLRCTLRMPLFRRSGGSAHDPPFQSFWSVFLGEIQCIVFHLMLSSCVAVCVSVCMPRCGCQENVLRQRRRFFFKLCGITPDIFCKFDTNRITNSKMADKMAAVKH